MNIYSYYTVVLCIALNVVIAASIQAISIAIKNIKKESLEDILRKDLYD